MLKEKIFHENTILFYILITMASLCAGYFSLGKNFDFDIYSSFQGDGTLLSAIIKSIQENGIAGIWFNNRLGVPEVSAFIDWPVIDLLMSLIIWCISVFTDSTPRIQYVYLLITFVLDALSMALLLRKLKINYETSFVISILFSVAPFHFFRYLEHATLSNYMSFALSVYLALNILNIVEEKQKDKWKIWVCGILIGIGYGYYYAFGLIVIAVAYFMRFLKLDNKKDILNQLWIGILVLITILLSLLPRLIYSVVNGSNQIVGKRSYIEQEIYGLKIIQLLLPPSYSRFSVLSSLNQEYSTKAPLVTENASASLGLIASIGFLILCVAMMISFTSNKKKDQSKWILIDFLSLSTLVLVLMGSIGGFGEIFNYFITAQIRCYNRCSIYIAGFSLIIVACFLDSIRKKKAWISMIACGMVLMIGLADQFKIPDNNSQNSLKTTQKQYEKFFSQVENELEKDTMVYQLPHTDFPEVSAAYDYKHFIGYLFTDTLRWSYGGIKGRNLAAGALNVDEGMSYSFLSKIKNAGFGAVYIDLSGYEDGGNQVLNFYSGLGILPIVSDDRLLYLYDISELEISTAMFISGYNFVSFWADTYRMDMTPDEKADIAEEIKNMDKKAYSRMYSAAKSIIEAYSDSDYADFLYLAILGRIESDEERDVWVESMRNGTSRQEIFYEFLNSQEFRMAQGFDKTTEGGTEK